MKIPLHCKCFLVNVLKIFRTAFLQNTEPLLLNFSTLEYTWISIIFYTVILEWLFRLRAVLEGNEYEIVISMLLSLRSEPH